MFSRTVPRLTKAWRRAAAMRFQAPGRRAGAFIAIATSCTVAAYTSLPTLTSCEGAVADFFAVEPKPSNLAEATESMQQFVRHNVKAGRKIVLVTSGGTTVPLEKNTVRYIDNFSTGSRGARSVEEFIKQGYAVIMLERAGSIKPFFKHVRAWADELLASSNRDSIWENSEGRLVLMDKPVAGMATNYRKLVANQELLFVDFTTITDYLHLLKAACIALDPAGPSGMIFLAAAVSDFYVPAADMATHKIQSKGGSESLELKLVPVPKMLGEITSKWCPDALSVSFKLETDERILMKKAHTAQHRYNMDVVVANLLQERFNEVIIAGPEGDERVKRSGSEPIEHDFIKRVVSIHDAALNSE